MTPHRVLSLGALVLASLALPACSSKPPVPEASTPAVDPTFVEAARVASNRLRMELQKELQTALQEGGPVAAIDVCRLRAGEIAAEVSASTALDVQRVSTRSRNPLNHADGVESQVIAQFERRPAFADTAFVRDGAPVYMRAIRIESPACLACHGPVESLVPELRTELQSAYPDDQATGFAQGDLRGAFVVKR